jgi:hypothetical protein
LQAGALVLNNGGQLVFNHTDAATFNTPVSGSGRIDKVNGAGDTTLTNVSSFTGSFRAQGGRMILQGDTNGTSYSADANGTLRFSSGSVNVGSASITATSSGAIEYDGAYVHGAGGFLRGPGTHTILSSAGATTFVGITTYNSTNIVQFGSASLVNFTNGGTITNNAPLTFDGGINALTGVINVNSTLNTYDVGNSGVVVVDSGGAINNLVGNLVSGGGSWTTINTGGAVNLLGGTTFELNGALLVNNGSVTGTVNVNYGSLAKGTGSYDIVNVNQGGIYSPGNSPGISTAASVAFNGGSVASGAPRLVMELGGTMAGTQYDQLHVTGTLTLGGTLDVELVDLGAGRFAPNAGDSFDILDWGNLAGTFSSLLLPALATGKSWDTSELYTTGVLSVVATAVPGDYNGDGIVGPEDYDVWAATFGSTEDLRADANHDGVVDAADYTVWRDHLGQMLGAGSGAAGYRLGASARPLSAAAPEPTSMLLLLAGGVCARVARKRLSICDG